jgi:hypothetical protein
VPAIDDRFQLAERPLAHNFTRADKHRHITRPKRHEMPELRGSNGGPHLVSLADIHADRFLANHVLPGCRASHHGLMVQRIGRGHDDEIHIGMGDDSSPVVRDEISGILLRSRFEQFASPGAQRDNSGFVVRIANLRAVWRCDVTRRPDHSDVESRHSSSSQASIVGQLPRAISCIITIESHAPKSRGDSPLPIPERTRQTT